MQNNEDIKMENTIKKQLLKGLVISAGVGFTLVSTLSSADATHKGEIDVLSAKATAQKNKINKKSYKSHL